MPVENRNMYIGHRYVPKIFGEWNQAETYEGLSIVTALGSSYTSKKRVPVGVQITNQEYWALTGNYNAQIEQYRQDVSRLNDDLIETNENLEGTSLTVSGLKRKQDHGWLDLIEDFQAKGDGSDDTLYFQNALNGSVGRTLYIPKSIGSHYLIGTIEIPSNTYIVMENGVQIKSKKLLSDNRMVRMTDVSNIRIEGNGSTFFMNKTEYTGEQNHIFHINGATNVTLLDINANDSGGDGFYISNTGTAKTYCENIKLIRCNANNNRRNNLSVISVDGFYADTCVFSNAGGADPQSGVDVEPNKASDRLKNIKFKNCKSINNVKEGFRVLIWHQDATSEFIDVTFEDCYSTGDNNGFIVKYVNDGSRGIIRFKDCIGEANEYNAFNFNNCSSLGVNIELENCDGVNANTLNSSGTSRNATFLIMDSLGNQPPTIGNVKMINCKSYDRRDIPIISRGFVVNNANGSITENLDFINCLSFRQSADPFDLANTTRKVFVKNDIPYIFKKSVTGTISTAHHNGQIVTNEGALAGVRLTLTEPKENVEITFRVDTPQALRVFPPAGNRITPLTSASGLGVESSTVGSSITLKAVGNNWIVKNMVGTWTEAI